MEEHDNSPETSNSDVLSDDARVGPLVRLAGLAHALETPDAPTPSRAELLDGLAALGAAEPALERAALVVTAHARAAGLTWPEMAAAHGGRADTLARRHARRRERFADYVPPLAPTLEAYTSHASDLLTPVLAERPLSPFLAHLAAERLGAVLLTAHWEQVDAVGVASWLSDDALSDPHHRLHHHYGDQADAVRGVLNAHALDPAPVQAALGERMRAALGAEELTQRPIHPPPRPAEAVTAAPSRATSDLSVRESEQAGAHVPASQDRDATVSLRTRRLTDAGLSADFAAALHEPLLNLEVSGELMYHDFIPEDLRQGSLVGALRAIKPTMMSRDAARLRLLLRTLPELFRGQGSLDLGRLEQAALGSLGDAYLQVITVLEEHRSELAEEDAVTVVSSARIPHEIGHLLHLMLRVARVPAVASWAPGGTSVAGPALTSLIAAVDDGQAHALPEALDAVSALVELDVPEPSHQLITDWESLVHAWRQDRSPDTADEGSWRAKTDRIMPDHPELAQALATFVDVLGGSAGVQSLAPLASDQRPYKAVYRLLKVIERGDRTKIGDALEDVLRCKPSRAPFGKRNPRGADALRALINAYDNQ